MEYKTQEHLDYIEQAIEEFYNSIHEEDNEQFYKYSNAKLLNFNIAIKDIYYDIIELVDNQIFPNIKESLYRQNLKETLEKRYKKLTYLIIANLYNAYFNVEQLMYYRNSIFYNMSNRECIISPNKNLFSYTMTTKVISTLYKFSYIYHATGYYYHKYSKGKLSRCFPRESLQNKFSTIIKNYEKEIEPERVTGVSDDLLLMRSPKDDQGKNHIVTNLIDEVYFPENKRQDKMFRLKQYKNDILELNKALKQAKIILYKPVTNHDKYFAKLMIKKRAMIYLGQQYYLLQGNSKRLKRVFNDANIEHGGRTYGYFQQFSSSTRKNIEINDEKVALIDISGSHLRMLYHIENLICNNQDLYCLFYNDNSPVEGIKIIRDINKKLTQTVINADNKDAAKRSALHSIKKVMKSHNMYDYAKMFNTLKHSEEWLEKFERLHKDINSYFYSGIGKYLQYLESEILISTMLELLREYNTVSLPIHDELIVPVSKKDITMEILKKHYRKQSVLNGHEPILDAKINS